VGALGNLGEPWNKVPVVIGAPINIMLDFCVL
jgi:hypothetical protein